MEENDPISPIQPSLGKKKRKPRVNPVQVFLAYTVGLLMVLAGVYMFTLSPVGPLPAALPYLQSDDQVQVTSGRYLFFQPMHSTAKTGLIFYPGGRVDYRSYAPMVHQLAEKGWSAAIVPMPLNLAVLGSDRADWVINDHPEIPQWVIAGHSLGGSMAAGYLVKNPTHIRGIAFLAAYPGGNELVNSTIPVLSIFGSEDGLITSDEWETRKPRFPATTQWLRIDGGNHAGFGWYGEQEGDRPAQISLEDQTAQIVQGLDRFLTIVENKN
ncbi:alpha/beta hydrolase [Leptolinea tardivitalis]|nr:alpha/beta hydrolase [Leptolinea tardivitalis]GAP19897.1 alpha/beta hydrolase family [Leptolinea tardivitalis]